MNGQIEEFRYSIHKYVAECDELQIVPVFSWNIVVGISDLYVARSQYWRVTEGEKSEKREIVSGRGKAGF